jgi:hypothetical protein
VSTASDFLDEPQLHHSRRRIWRACMLEVWEVDAAGRLALL